MQMEPLTQKVMTEQELAVRWIVGGIGVVWLLRFIWRLFAPLLAMVLLRRGHVALAMRIRFGMRR